MSKSQGNTITLSASDAEIKAAIASMYTDPDHLKVTDPGRIEGNVVFTYLDAFDTDHEAVAELKAHYRRGGLGDVAIKQRLTTVLCDVIGPIRERRAEIAHDLDSVMDMLQHGTAQAHAVTNATKAELQEALGLFTWGKPSDETRISVSSLAPVTRSPQNKQDVGSLEDVRENIDRLDRDIIRLMAERGTFVEQAARFKASRVDVEAPHRVEQVIEKVTALAAEAGLAPQVAEAAYRSMIAAFIEVEHVAFQVRQASTAETVV